MTKNILISRDCAFPVLRDMFSSFCRPESSNSFRLKKLVTTVANARGNVLNKWVAALSFHTTLLGSIPVYCAWFVNHPHVSHTQEELENLAEDKSPKLSSESLSCSLELEVHASAIIWLNYVHTNERSINFMLKPFEWMNVLPFWFWARNFVSKIAQEIERDKRLLSKKFNDIWGRVSL